MEQFMTVMLLGGALFAAIVVLLAAKPRLALRLTGAAAVISAVGGLLIYGYIFLTTVENLTLVVIRTLFSVCCMFVAATDFSAVSEAPFFRREGAELLFWILHLIAFYATSSAVLSTIGAGALRKLRLWLARWGELHLVYGVNANSLDFGQELLAQDNGSVVYIDSKTDAAEFAAIAQDGCVLRSDDAAENATVRFLKSIGIRRGRRKITLYALSEDMADNLRYARAFLTSLQALGITPEQTSLVIHGREASAVTALQVRGEQYGYGFVTVFQEPGLAARLLVRSYPPCDQISFDAEGRAAEDFEALIVGFGQMGQAVLKSLVMNGQFAGSSFHAAVFSPDCQSVNGYFSSSMKAVLDHYDITFHPYDGRSRQMYEHLQQRGEKIKYIVVCTGSEKRNQEITEEFTSFFASRGLRIPVYQCSYRGITCYDADTQQTDICRLYHPSVLSTDRLDRMAMIINHYYQGPSERTALEDWMACDYFSRMSCRASADFTSAMLRAAGKTEEQVLSGDWNFSGGMLENLSRMEHERWCAFHYCMGFTPMSEEEYAARAREYRAQMERDGKAAIRIGKNMEKRTHACLIPWEELEELSRRENAVTGKNVNYQQMDTDNVLVVPQLLQSCAEK